MTFPDVGIADNFTRADENPLTVSSSGITWLVTPDQAGLGLTPLLVQSNLCAANSGQSFMYLNSSYGPDVQAAVTVNAVGAATSVVDLWIRATNYNVSILTANAYNLRYTENAGTDTVVFSRYDAATPTTLATYNQEVDAGDSIGISAIGNVITAYYKAAAGSWGTLGSVTESTYSAAGFVAMTIGSTLIRAQNLYAGTVILPRTSLLGAGD